MSLNQDFEEEYQRGYEAGRRAALAEFHTEWGVDSSWGTDGIRGSETAHGTALEIASNIRSAGHEAHVVWRGVTGWHKEES